MLEMGQEEGGLVIHQLISRFVRSTRFNIFSSSAFKGMDFEEQLFKDLYGLVQIALGCKVGAKKSGDLTKTYVIGMGILSKSNIR